MLPTPPPPLPLTPPDEEPDYANMGRLDANGRFVAVAALVLLSPVVVDWLAVSVMRSGGGILAGVLLASVWCAKLVLLALWLAWGGSWVVVRLAVVGISLAITCLVMDRADAVSRHWPLWMLSTLVLAAIIAVPRMFGARWVMLTPASLGQIPPRTVRAGQFSLFDIFVGITSVACLLGVFRWVEPPRNIEWLPILFYTSLGGLTMLLYLWAMLGPEGTMFGRFWLAWFISLMLGVVLGLLNGALENRAFEAIFFFLMFALVYSTLLLASMGVLRAMGARFTRRDGGY